MKEYNCSEANIADMLKIGQALQDKKEEFIKLGHDKRCAEKLAMDMFVKQIMEKIENIEK